MKTVYVDVDTQFDFMVPSGALYVSGAERVIPAIAALNRHAAGSGSTVISTTDAHLENDEEFHHWPAHCVEGTLGQKKPPETLLDKQAVVPWRESVTDITGAQQIIVKKRVLDAFRNPNLAAVLNLLQADRYVLYGVVTEICVACAAEGLQKLGKPVELVSDAVKAIKQGEADEMIRNFRERGGVVTSIADVLRA
jgi:nicotinamidase/pyrazinamidase